MRRSQSGLILPDVGPGAGSYGSEGKTLIVQVDAKGRVVAITPVDPQVPASAISSGQIPVARGGTGADLSGGAGVLKANGGVISASQVTNDDVAVGANIARSKLAPGSANRVVLTDAQGNIVDAAAGTDGQVLTLVGGAPAWADAAGGGAAPIEAAIAFQATVFGGGNGWYNFPGQGRMPASVISGGTGTARNIMYSMPLVVGRDGTLTELAIRVLSGTAAKAYLFVYECAASGYPDALVAVTSEIDCAITGFRNMPVSAALSASKTYRMGAIFGGTAGPSLYYYTGNAAPLEALHTTMSSGQSLQVAQTYGIPPATHPAGASWTTISNHPLVMFRMTFP